jgi:NAD(P)-dependent dehydrogenase (short-subunit alcohol dehydrogenase family)
LFCLSRCHLATRQVNDHLSSIRELINQTELTIVPGRALGRLHRAYRCKELRVENVGTSVAIQPLAEGELTASAWVEATAARFGRIDGLVNNAGILHPLDLRSGDESLLDEMWAVNVRAPFRLIRLALPHREGRPQTDHRRCLDRRQALSRHLSRSPVR